MIFIKINGTDRTSFINWRSFKWEQNLTNKADMLSFVIKNYQSKIYSPDVMDEIELLQGATIGAAVKLFGGHIIEIEESIEGRVISYAVVAKDYSHKMDANLVIKEYKNQTINQVINDIKTNFLPAGYTTNGVSAPGTVKYLKLNYEQPSKCFQQLAELFNHDWYVDENKDIKFFAKESNFAPFSLTDTNGNYIFESLKIKRKADQLRNTIFVRGDEYVSTGTQVENVSHQADGANKIFKLGYRYKNYILKVNGATKTVGVENMTDPATVDALYNFEEKVIKFATAPAGTDSVTFEGNIYIPLRIKWKDNASIGKYGGEYQYLVIDKSIKDDAGAKDMAKAEIVAYADQLNEGSFRTYEDGLRVGQMISIQSDIRGIAEAFIITKVSAQSRSGENLEYAVQIATTRTMDFVDLMQKVLTAKNKEIEITDDEVLVKVEGFIETITWQEVWSVNRYPREAPTFSETIRIQENWRVDPWGAQIPIWVAGPYYPTDGNDRKRAARTNAGAKTT